MKRIIVNILIVFYVIITIPITLLLINYNDYDVTVLGNNTLLIPRKTELVGYDKNSLLIVSKNIKNIKAGDTILYYDTYKANVSIKNDKVASIIENPKTFIVASSLILSLIFTFAKLYNTTNASNPAETINIITT